MVQIENKICYKRIYPINSHKFIIILFYLYECIFIFPDIYHTPVHFQNDLKYFLLFRGKLFPIVVKDGEYVV